MNKKKKRVGKLFDEGKLVFYVKWFFEIDLIFIGDRRFEGFFKILIECLVWWGCEDGGFFFFGVGCGLILGISWVW